MNLSENPRYEELPGALDLGIIIGNSWGPMDIIPEVAEDISLRTYHAAVYDKQNVKICDFIVEIIDVTVGSLRLFMPSTESSKLTKGTWPWDLYFIDLEFGKNTLISGTVEARYR